MSQETPKNTYVTLHKNFVRTDIEYADRRTGEVKTFNSVTLPKGTVIDGRDVSYYQFSPLFVNESRYRGEDYRDIPSSRKGRSGSARASSTRTASPSLERTASS